MQSSSAEQVTAFTTTTELPADADGGEGNYDFVIVGGGTAGCVIGSRLSASLPNKRILMIEAGPSDFSNAKVLLLKDWLNLLGGELDFDYPTTEQPNGNSHIRHSRAKVLGGCSSHNTLISFRTLEYDCQRWEAQGCQGWGFQELSRLLDKLKNTIQPVALKHRNQLMSDWVESCSKALAVPVVSDFNGTIRTNGNLPPCAGFLPISYNPENGHRSSASVAYIHPILRGEESRSNLTILTEAWVEKVIVRDRVATAINVRLKDGSRRSIRATCEIILCAGAIDTPRLLLLSGIGPKSQLCSLGIESVADIPGVGENLQDHPESIVMWDLWRPIDKDKTTMDADAAVFMRREPFGARGKDGGVVDLMFHCYQGGFCFNTERLGYVTPENAFCMTPNICRPRSRGRLYLTSSDPSVKPALDFCYFTDPEGYDAATIVAGIRAARKVAEQSPFKEWIRSEVAPGAHIQSDEALSEFGRRAAHTVYHPVGTTKMGDLRYDPLAVVDTDLKVRGIGKLRIADAGVFPELTTVNPMLTVLAIGEKAAELIAQDHSGSTVTEKAKL